ncbi:MAG: LacI family DNA-binding transcriptional regulator [Caldimonas sp.]
MRSTSAGPPRMQDVAAAAGVSMITVSRALSEPAKLAPATRARVQAAIDLLHYVPNLTAGSLASRRSRIVAAIVPTLANSIFSDTVDGLAQALVEGGYQLLLGQSRYREAEEAALVDAFLGRRVDGLVLTGVRHARGVRARLQRAGVPVVETWDLAARPIDMVVGFSNRRAGEAAARYLAGKGYGRLAFVGGEDDRSRERLEGFQAGARACKAGRVAVDAVPSSSSLADGSAAMGRLLRLSPPVGAVLCVNDMLAAGALFECRRRAVPVPARMAVMGFADLPIAAAIEPGLTSIQVRSEAMGQHAGALLLQRLRGGSRTARIVDLGFAVVERASA